MRKQTQRWEGTLPRPHSWLVAEANFGPRLSGSSHWVLYNLFTTLSARTSAVSLQNPDTLQMLNASSLPLPYSLHVELKFVLLQSLLVVPGPVSNHLFSILHHSHSAAWRSINQFPISFFSRLTFVPIPSGNAHWLLIYKRALTTLHVPDTGLSTR